MTPRPPREPAIWTNKEEACQVEGCPYAATETVEVTYQQGGFTRDGDLFPSSIVEGKLRVCPIHHENVFAGSLKDVSIA